MRLRSLVIPVAALAALLVGTLAFGGLGGDLVYYLTPTEAVAGRPDTGTGARFRLAGTVAPGSLGVDGELTRFTVTDGQTSVEVRHTGIPPQLFQEDIQVVVEGSWRDGVFTSDTMLVKHDEQYYPPEEVPS